MRNTGFRFAALLILLVATASSASELGGYRHALLALAGACCIALMLSVALRGRVSADRAARGA